MVLPVVGLVLVGCPFPWTWRAMIVRGAGRRAAALAAQVYPLDLKLTVAAGVVVVPAASDSIFVPLGHQPVTTTPSACQWTAKSGVLLQEQTTEAPAVLLKTAPLVPVVLLEAAHLGAAVGART